MSASCRFFRALWLQLVLVAAAADEQGEGCSGSAKRCGNVTISDPFWLADEEIGRSCGSPDFVAVCDSNFTGFPSPVLRSAMPFSDGFAVLSISYEERRLHAIDVGKLHVLQAPNSCHVPIWNSSVKLRPSFRIDPANLNLIFYNCTEEAAAAAARRDRELGPTDVGGGDGREVLVRAGVPYDATGSYGGYAWGACHAVVTPMMGSSTGANASDFERLIDGGFLLKWHEPPHRARKFTRQIIF
uniref:Wall-associated receptor kinase galacturonan-binding domain-containing protein n=1 Tax=Aegilops tauschii TaxID=37682 RepID=M8BNK2_AEGTA